MVRQATHQQWGRSMKTYGRRFFLSANRNITPCPPWNSEMQSINNADRPMLKSPTECDNENNDDDHDNNGKAINFSNTSISFHYYHGYLQVDSSFCFLSCMGRVRSLGRWTICCPNTHCPCSGPTMEVGVQSPVPLLTDLLVLDPTVCVLILNKVLKIWILHNHRFHSQWRGRK